MLFRTPDIVPAGTSTRLRRHPLSSRRSPRRLSGLTDENRTSVNAIMRPTIPPDQEKSMRVAAKRLRGPVSVTVSSRDSKQRRQTVRRRRPAHQRARFQLTSAEPAQLPHTCRRCPHLPAGVAPSSAPSAQAQASRTCPETTANPRASCGRRSRTRITPPKTAKGTTRPGFSRARRRRGARGRGEDGRRSLREDPLRQLLLRPLADLSPCDLQRSRHPRLSAFGLRPHRHRTVRCKRQLADRTTAYPRAVRATAFPRCCRA